MGSGERWDTGEGERGGDAGRGEERGGDGGRGEERGEEGCSFALPLQRISVHNPAL